MIDTSDILARVRSAAGIRMLYLPHAVRQMLRPERMITTGEVRQVIAMEFWLRIIQKILGAIVA